MKKVTYSVIVPVYNAKGYLSRCINSVLNQNYSDFELILVDDGSTDNSVMICEAFAKKDSRIKVFHKKNGGVSSARNLGLDNATGKYIVFVDSDDYIEKNYLEQFSKYDDADVVMIGYVVENEKSETITNRSYSPNMISTNGFAQAFVDGHFNYVWAKAIKKDVILKANSRFDERLSVSEDTLFMVDLLPETQKIRVLDGLGYHYVKYSHTTLTNYKSKYKLMDSVENANDIIDRHVKSSFGKDSDYYVTIRIGKLYSELLNVLFNDTVIDKELLKFLFSKKWFRKTLKYADEIYCDESSKFRALLKTKSYMLIYIYLNYFR